MSEQLSPEWEDYIHHTAQALTYPVTPDIATRLPKKDLIKQAPSPSKPYRWQMAWAISIILIVGFVLLAVPPVRAAVLEILQLGAVRIFLVEPTETATIPLTSTAMPPLEETATADPTPTPLAALLDLAGQTTLAEAQAHLDFPIRLPSYPEDLGTPDFVFLQDIQGPAVILVWLNPENPAQVDLSLHILGAEMLVQKIAPPIIKETSVNNNDALWTTGPYLVKVNQDSYGMRWLVEGHALIWVEDEITYRLETHLSLAEAVQIAESLH